GNIDAHLRYDALRGLLIVRPCFDARADLNAGLIPTSDGDSTVHSGIDAKAAGESGGLLAHFTVTHLASIIAIAVVAGEAAFPKISLCERRKRRECQNCQRRSFHLTPFRPIDAARPFRLS